MSPNRTGIPRRRTPGSWGSLVRPRVSLRVWRGGRFRFRAWGRRWGTFERRETAFREDASMIVVGIDLGQSSDYTAICVARRPDGGRIWEVPHLERLPLGTSYVDAARHVVELVSRPELSDAYIAVDRTGVGAPVCDLLRSRLPRGRGLRFR